MNKKLLIVTIILILFGGLAVQAWFINSGSQNYLPIVIAIAIMTAVSALNQKDASLRAIFQFLLGFIILVLINFIGSFAFSTVDLTAEKRHTLHPATKEFLNSLEDVVFVKIYLEGDFSSDFKKLQKATKEKLDIFRSYSKGNLEYEFINPSESEDETVRNEVYAQLQKEGLQYSTETTGKGTSGERIIWPGAILNYRDLQQSLNLVSGQAGMSKPDMINKAINDLEYNLTNAIRKFARKYEQKVAIISGHGELEPIDIYDFQKSLSEYYEVERVEIEGKYKALYNYDAIIIAKPTEKFSRADKFVIDQFIMHGGKALWLVDPMHATLDSLQTKTISLAVERPLNIEDQLFKYGVRLNNNLVMDMRCAPIPIMDNALGGQQQMKLYPWYYDPLILPIVDHPIVKNLSPIRGAFTSTLDTVGNPEVKKTILLQTSKYSRAVNTPVRLSLKTATLDPKTQLFNKPFLPLAALLEGEFESVFANVMPTNLDQVDGLKTPLEVSVPTKQIVIADGDIIKNNSNAATERIDPLGYDKYTGTIYSNTTFLLNAMNYLMDDSGLISVRARDLELRLMDPAKTKDENNYWKLINILIPLLLIALFGAIQYYIRKYKYTR